MNEEARTAYLEVESAAESRRIPITPERSCSIGRSEGNTLVLVDDMASRNHALIQGFNQGAIFYLTDLGSTNGTLLNGTRVTAPVALRQGDRIQVGSQKMVFHHMFAEPASHPNEEEQKSTSVLVRMKEITVLVVDIRDYTGLTQRSGSEKVGEVSSFLFREAGRVLQAHGAWTQKYIGDAVMAVWMHDSTAEARDIVPVLKALVSLRDVTAGLAARFQLREAVRIGAGINTGMAYTGNFGSNAASDHTAMGDTVIKAFRLESVTKEIGCDLAIGLDVFKVCADRPGAAGLLTPTVVRLKGYTEPETVYAARMSGLEGLVKALAAPPAGLGTIPPGP